MTNPEEWTRQRIEAALTSDEPHITVDDGLWLLERCRPLHAGAEPEEQPEAVTTFTPMVWMLLTNEQRYEEYVRVRKLAAALSSSRTAPEGPKP